MTEEECKIAMALSEKDDAIRAAANLANALRDIYNDLGEMPQIKAAFTSVENLVSEYSGLENY
tara:strand:+ start:1353 stop:1541 length:189 start_codon:yes stop_codon:yes gene_type:complete